MNCYVPIVNKIGLDSELLQQPNDLSTPKWLPFKHKEQNNLACLELKQDSASLLSPTSLADEVDGCGPNCLGCSYSMLW